MLPPGLNNRGTYLFPTSIRYHHQGNSEHPKNLLCMSGLIYLVSLIEIVLPSVSIFLRLAIPSTSYFHLDHVATRSLHL